MAPFSQREDQVETKTAGTHKMAVVDLEVWSKRLGKRFRWHPTHWGSHLKLFLGQLNWKYLEADMSLTHCPLETCSHFTDLM